MLYAFAEKLSTIYYDTAKQIRNPAGEDTFSLAPDEAGTVAGGRTYRLDSSEKNKDTI